MATSPTTDDDMTPSKAIKETFRILEESLMEAFKPEPRAAMCIHCEHLIPYERLDERERVWSEMAEHEAVCAKNPVLLMVAAAEAERDMWRRRYDEAVAKHPTADYERARYRRWNIEESSDGTLSVCKGEHDKAQGCSYEEFIPESHHRSLLNAYEETCTHSQKRATALLELAGGWRKEASSRGPMDAYGLGQATAAEQLEQVLRKADL